MNDVIIEVRGGVVTSVYSGIADARYIVVDWDARETGEDGVSAGFAIPAADLDALPQETRREYGVAVANDLSGKDRRSGCS